MNKEGLVLFVCIVCTLLPATVIAQQSPMVQQGKSRFIVTTTPRSAGPAFRPDPDSPITKLRYKAPEPVMLALHDKIIENGLLKPGSDDCFFKLPLETDGVFFGEMIPEQKTPEQVQLFFNLSPMTAMFNIESKGDNVLKLIHFEPVLEEQRLSTIPVLLVYEDDPESGTNEQLVQKYTKDGKLIVDKVLNEELLSQLLNYRLIHYNIQYKEE
ncbi:MAG: hypothetical protein LUH10_00780 [Tannerellaceae bacterium]|nr:hypothetical protein [Tannerellaceae bacterium]